MTDSIEEPQAPTDGDLLAELGTDAEKWAIKLRDTLGLAGLEVEVMLPWFVNAIGAGESAGYARGVAESTPDLKDIFAPPVTTKDLKDYKLGEPIEVCVMGLWVPGHVGDELNAGIVLVNTERGPRTIMSTRNIRPRG